MSLLQKARTISHMCAASGLGRRDTHSETRALGYSAEVMHRRAHSVAGCSMLQCPVQRSNYTTEDVGGPRSGAQSSGKRLDGSATTGLARDVQNNHEGWQADSDLTCTLNMHQRFSNSGGPILSTVLLQSLPSAVCITTEGRGRAGQAPDHLPWVGCPHCPSNEAWWKYQDLWRLQANCQCSFQAAHLQG